MSHLPGNVNHLDRVLSLMHRNANPIAITLHSKGGLLVVNQNYSDLIGPGSRLIFPKHFHCTAIFAVGQVTLCTLHSASARQKSLRNRVAGIMLLERILQDCDELHRACLLVNLLCSRLSLRVVKQADLALLGQLARVSAAGMEAAINLYEQNLCRLGQNQQLGDTHRLLWQRQVAPLPERLSEAVDFQDLDADSSADHEKVMITATSILSR